MSGIESQEELLTRLLRNEQEASRGLRARVEQLQDVFLFLRPLVNTDPSGYGAESSVRYCPYCRASEDMDDVPVQHFSDCPWWALATVLRTEEPEK